MSYTVDPNAKELKYIRSMVSNLAANTNLAFTTVSKEFAKSKFNGSDARGASFEQGRQSSYPSGMDTADVRAEINLINSRLTKVE